MTLTLSQTTNFRLYQTERVCRKQFQVPSKWQKVPQIGRKTVREKEKLLVTSNFSFSHSVLKRLFLQTRKNQGLFGKGLKGVCYGRPLLQAWLLSDLNTISNSCIGGILFSSVVMVLAFGSQGHWFKSCPDLVFLPCIDSLVSMLWTLFLRTSQNESQFLSYMYFVVCKSFQF